MRHLYYIYSLHGSGIIVVKQVEWLSEPELMGNNNEIVF